MKLYQSILTIVTLFGFLASVGAQSPPKWDTDDVRDFVFNDDDFAPTDVPAPTAPTTPIPVPAPTAATTTAMPTRTPTKMKGNKVGGKKGGKF